MENLKTKNEIHLYFHYTEIDSVNILFYRQKKKGGLMLFLVLCELLSLNIRVVPRLTK